MMLQSKSLRTVIALLTAILLVGTMFFIPETSSAKTKGYHYEIIDKSETYDGGNMELYYKYPQVDGDTEAIHKVNRHFKGLATKFMKEHKDCNGTSWEDMVNEYARNYGTVTMVATVDSTVTYKSKRYISVRYTENWFAGGVSNTAITAETYDLKTGKKVNLLKATGKSYKSLRKTIAKKLKKKYGKSDSTIADNYLKKYNTKKKVKNQYYYLDKKRNVVCCFPVYDISYGAMGSPNVKLKKSPLK